tara:strand:- start:1089 stop:1193 length:105 start_codon:yes stop_codon:yes gene_type:complete
VRAIVEGHFQNNHKDGEYADEVEYQNEHHDNIPL